MTTPRQTILFLCKFAGTKPTRVKCYPVSEGAYSAILSEEDPSLTMGGPSTPTGACQLACHETNTQTE